MFSCIILFWKDTCNIISEAWWVGKRLMAEYFKIFIIICSYLISGIPVVNIPQPSYSIEYGNPITIECTVTANPLHTIVIWQKIVNGQPTTINQGNSGRYTGGTVNTPSLTIQSAVTSDTGVYRCLATNAVGTGQSQDTTLTITGGLCSILSVVIFLAYITPCII